MSVLKRLANSENVPKVEIGHLKARLEQRNREIEVRQADEVIMNESEDEVQDTESHISHGQNALVKTKGYIKSSVPKTKRRLLLYQRLQSRSTP